MTDVTVIGIMIKQGWEKGKGGEGKCFPLESDGLFKQPRSLASKQKLVISGAALPPDSLFPSYI